jgi:Protein of unknown function (DUF3891)
MIVRKEPDGTLLMIGQTEHSRLVGQMAAHWGNGTFAAAQPYDSVVRAAVYHDYGWLRYETSPVLDDKTGATPDFRQVGGRQLESYQWCVDWMSAIDRYSGLLVSMHRTGLWKNRYGTIAYPDAYNPRVLGPEVEAFIARHEAWQESERRARDAAEVWWNYRLLQAWDLLGLYFCCQEPREDRIEPVPLQPSAGKTDGVRLTLNPLAPRKVALDPYPFAARPVRVQLSGRRLPAQHFPDLAGFRRAYFQAPVELAEFELV